MKSEDVAKCRENWTRNVKWNTGLAFWMAHMIMYWDGLRQISNLNWIPGMLMSFGMAYPISTLNARYMVDLSRDRPSYQNLSNLLFEQICDNEKVTNLYKGYSTWMVRNSAFHVCLLTYYGSQQFSQSRSRRMD